jgi:putative two-component system hydrogenase maturation factor HypX/HoxX
MRQADRAIDWAAEDTETVLRKLHAADGSPGVLDQLYGEPVLLFGGKPSTRCAVPPGW